MIKIIGARDQRDSFAINSTSSSLNWSRELSPFLLGPVSLYQNYTALKFENAWQYSKVYLEFTDLNKDPNGSYWKWAQEGWKNPWAVRYPLGKNRMPLYSLWNNEKLSYIDARKQIYIPLYQNLVKETEAFKKICQIYKETGSITIFDYDGYDYSSLNMSLDDVLNCSSRKMGHGFVLAMMLQFGANFKIEDLIKR